MSVPFCTVAKSSDTLQLNLIQRLFFGCIFHTLCDEAKKISGNLEQGYV